ncbi:MAG: metabolite traffic protein EboE [Nitrospirae bacterium]|nr:metabolite traffic protein EboE [Nitrospirota bacterium]
MITYCTNIHPGESWDEVLLNLRTHVLEVKKTVSPDKSFPIGLRLSNLASTEIDEKASACFSEWCQQQDCYVATINGFPYGSFHSPIVKEKVYLPDWRDRKRVEYTKRLAGLLDAWMPAGVTGSISTVPVGFKDYIGNPPIPPLSKGGEGGFDIIRKNLMTVLKHLDSLKQRSGKEIILSLEPEPGCVLETTEDVVNFLGQMNFPGQLKENIGVCFDCCHHAVEFEEPSKALSRIDESGIRLGKVQVSSALRLVKPHRETLDKFAEPCYLHQTVVRKQDGSLIRYNDLSDALRDYQENAEEEWRIHFHVPVFFDKSDSYGTTRDFTEEVISILYNPSVSPLDKGGIKGGLDKNILLEVETYTWDVLPSELQMNSVTQSIIREIQWVQEQIKEKN